MPRTYKKLGLRCRWTKDDLQKAVEDIKANNFTIRAAARAYQIPRTTLQQYVNSKTRKHQLSADHEPGRVGRYPALGKDFETELCEHAKLLSDLYFGITKEQLCKLAYELAWKNGMKHPFNVDKQSAGDDWFQGFIARNPTISLRKAESTSIARVIGFRRSEVSRFFDNLAQVYDKEKFDASRVFNVDETGMSTVQVQKQKILAPTGKKQIGKIVSAEKGETITAVVCVSASGTFIPPMLIFPRKNMNPRLLNGAPPGTVGATSPSGWINGDLYLKWLKHFIQHTAATVDRKVMLILDNHESHVTLQAYEMCRENGVIVVSLPPHCSHKCQPLDLAVFGPLKTAYYKRCTEWMRMNPGQRITQYQIASLFGDAYCASANLQKCISGFRASGIYPLNSGVFTDADFQAAENLVPVRNTGTETTHAVADAGNTTALNTTPSNNEVQLEPGATVTAAKSSSSMVEPRESDTTAVNAAVDGGVLELEPAATTSHHNEVQLEPASATTAARSSSSTVEPEASDTTVVGTAVDGGAATTSTTSVESSSFTVEPEANSATPMKKHAKKRVSVTEISPLPVATPKENTRRKKCKRSEIFTASPMKLILTAKASKKDGMDSAKKAESSIGNKGKRKASGEKQQKRKRTKVAGITKQSFICSKLLHSSFIGSFIAESADLVLRLTLSHGVVQRQETFDRICWKSVVATRFSAWLK